MFLGTLASGRRPGSPVSVWVWEFVPQTALVGVRGVSNFRGLRLTDAGWGPKGPLGA